MGEFDFPALCDRIYRKGGESLFVSCNLTKVTTEPGKGAFMICPHCQHNLREIVYEGVSINTCDNCGGNWLDKGEIVHINETREVTFTAEDHQKLKEAGQTVTKKNIQRDNPIQCPRCNVPMETLNYAYSTGVMVDHCPKCDGLWLDKGELETIQMIIEEWEDKTPEIEAKFQPVLQNIKQDLSEERKADIDEVVAKEPKLLGFLNPLIKAILYKVV